MRRTFHIFINSGGHARYVETVENLAAARKRLRQVAQNASGDCFLYSSESGTVDQLRDQTKNFTLRSQKRPSAWSESDGRVKYRL